MVPSGRTTATSPSIKAWESGRDWRAAAREGKLAVQSLPLRLMRRARPSCTRARMRYPSNFSSCSQPSPSGASVTSVASWRRRARGSGALRAPGTSAAFTTAVFAFAAGVAAAGLPVRGALAAASLGRQRPPFVFSTGFLSQTASRSAAICSSVRPESTLSGLSSVTSYPGRAVSSVSLMSSQLFSSSRASRPRILTSVQPPFSFSPRRRNFKLARAVALVVVLDRLPRAAVPQEDVAPAVLFLRDHALELAVFERVVLDLDRQPLIAGS